MSLVTVLITVWKRNYLDEQLAALFQQSIMPDSIWIQQNEKLIDIEGTIRKYTLLFPNIKCFRSDYNLKFFGRFSLALHASTDYILILDDDVIPAPKWLETCIAKSNLYGSVISCTGRIIPPENFTPEAISEEQYKDYFIGDNYNNEENNYCPADTQVDYGCNSYFFRTEWLKLFWKIWPCTFQSGEDIHLSGVLKILQSIPTIVPAQTNPGEYGNLRKKYSNDEFSSWRNNDFISARETVLRYLICKHNWKPILWN